MAGNYFASEMNINMDTFSNVLKGDGPLCDGCSVRLNFFKRKRNCVFCKSLFCSLCLIRRADKKLCCKNCEILTARPLDKAKLLKLRNRDLVNYLTSRRIPINGCVEKEDLVNTLVRAVNNSSFHPQACSARPSTYSYPNSPSSNAFSNTNAKRKLAHSVENLSASDGIRVCGESSLDGIRVTPVASENQLDNDSDTLDFELIDTSELDPSTSSEPVEEITIEEPDSSTSPTSTQPSIGVTIEEVMIDEAEVAQVEFEEEVEESVVITVPETKKPLLLSDIHSQEDLTILSVKQLKELLIRNRTTYKGCLERAELLQKVTQLWVDYKIARKDIEKLTIEELCKICMDAPIECVLLECGHMCTCTGCGKQLSECPICRQFVIRCVRTFKA